MEVDLINRSGDRRKGLIQETSKEELQLLKKWKFNWLDLYESGENKVFQIFTNKIEGLIKIEFVIPDFFEMKNIEVSPTNYGADGMFVNVAKILISYGCLLSFELNKGPYKGYLSFVSKGRLIDYYIKEYNAELVFRERMIINPSNGLRLIKKHLNIEL